jgi:ribosomal protein L11 methyltransferase
MLTEQLVDYQVAAVEQQNWNAEWESEWEAVDVEGERPIRIRAEHHQPAAEGVLDVVIAPRMSFGTGHHTTTALMAQTIASMSVDGLTGLDMGCGTALLAILARKHGATDVTGIDIDEFAYENARENIRLNNTPDIDIRLGGTDALRDGEEFDYILANINRNILLADMGNYAAHMHSGSVIFMSGFYVEDMPMLQEEASRHSLRFVRHAEDNRWTMMEFIKE